MNDKINLLNDRRNLIEISDFIGLCKIVYL